MNFVPLNIKTNYELLSSMIKLDELILFAKKNNITSLSITDTNMFDTINFYNKCVENGIKPIIGVTLNIEDITFNLYALNYEGVKNLYKIITEKNLNTLTLKVIDKYKDNLKCVLDYNSLDKYKELNKIFKKLYVSYKNKEEKINALVITKNIVYMNKVLCLSSSDTKYLSYLYMIKEGKTVSDKKEYNFSENYLNINLDAIDKESTINFIEDIDIVFPIFKFKLPVYSEDSTTLLRSLCKKGLNKRFNNKVKKEYVDRLKYELDIIEKMGYVDYFLIVYDFILYAKKNKIIVGPGRGSAAGSLVSYSLGITEIDPIEYDLIFERFLNPDRISMPDIDCDFEYLRRDEVVEYVREKYGNKNVANIITFGTLLSKQVIRDVARVLELETYEVDKICKYIKDKDTINDLKKVEEFVDLIMSNNKYKKLINISSKFEGLKRHTSIHAAGVVISDEELTNKMPLYKSGNSILTSYSMEYLEGIGILKMDFLALKNLTIIDNVIKLIEDNLSIKINLSDIKFDDKETIKLFNEVSTVGIFQLESSGMKSFLHKLKIKTFDDVVAALALYRPGPRENIDTYIRRKEGKEKVNYLLPELEPILKSTYGIMIYQEQILEVLRKIGGYTYSEADNIRRAMSKKKESVILSEKENFVSRCVKKNIDKDKAIKLYDLILRFSNYGFNKSHAVSYAVISFYMAYLKAHYKEYFMTNLLNTVIGSDIKTKEYIDELRVLGLNISKPNINKSDKYYIVENNTIIAPLSIIKNVGIEANKLILEERKKGKFKSYSDFVSRVYGKSVNIKTIESLIDSGALECFNYNKKTLHHNLESMINYAELVSKIDKSLALKPEINEQDEYTEEELMNREYNLYGFYLSTHPITKYKRDNSVLLKDIENYFDKIINIIVLIDNIKVINTKNKERMAFLTVSDEYRKLECVIFPKTYNQIANITKGNITKITGRVEKRMDSYQLIVNDIEILK